ncbi:Autophagy-related protein 13 [Penicillium macrosclerotiorum]|uniref:Autophagy-related protein 13 n=1 Tax=Penicillium macrosclerotiorum TaxID=303699 RepID=UPI00254928B3|nr:Autophagy-related protein 13 [Penicillium macrosclerotiorum]KAJ5669567.1 Autophagy-related protein 13 [Penicillium macrosclerotiorum]
MHQHPRSPAVSSSAPRQPSQPASARNDLRGMESNPSSSSADTRSRSTKGLGIDAGQESTAENPREAIGPGKEVMAKLNQIISNYHTKAALIILDSRVELPPVYAKNSDKPKVNRWFNVELEETDALREQLWTWRTCDAIDHRPPPLIIETYLDGRGLTNNQSLVILDENGKRWDVRESLAGARGPNANPQQADADEIILERWTIELGEAAGDLPVDLGALLPTVYKKSIILFRSLFTYSKFLPAWKFSQRGTKLRRSPALQIRYRVIDGSRPRSGRSPDSLTVPLYEGHGKVVDTYRFGVTESPAGPFSVSVAYRTNCDFRVDDSEALLSSRFMGADDDIFRPSLPSEDAPRLNPEVGSVPVEKRTVESPDCSRAYGSLSTFHQVGPTTGASPISALRAARDSAVGSSSPSDSPSKKLLPAAKIAPPGRAAQLAGEGDSSNFARRPSVSFQAFKAPPLSASPVVMEPALGVSPRTSSTRVSTGTSAESRVMPPPSTAASARRTAALASEQAIASSNSASPKTAPLSRYSSSFSHRRGRPSSGGTPKIDDDNSSGRASAASSNVQPSSGLFAEAAGTSAESIHADDENISEFLKMLDTGKDLMNPSRSTSIQSSQRKPTATSAALARFRGMRESNAALSDSISSSMHMHRSSASSSKHLSGVPPMVAGTSISTASSPGKPISPHTPHTPAIRSRLSSNSVADDIAIEHDRRVTHVEHDSPLEENPNLENSQSAALIAAAIDIPTSPRVFAPAYRRSSSAAQRRRPTTSDDEEMFPFVLRSMSLGAEDTPHLGPTQQQQTDYENSDVDPTVGRRSSSADDPSSSAAAATGTITGRSQPVPGPSATSSSSNVYQPRFASSRGRGFSGGHSLSSASSSLARGAIIPSHLAERDDRDGSGSNSGNSTMELRRGSGQRPSIGRGPPSQTPFEDDEPLLFAMSDFGASRRSLEENRHGNHGGTDSNGGSRRGSGRRGAGLPGFHNWS